MERNSCKYYLFNRLFLSNVSDYLVKSYEQIIRDCWIEMIKARLIYGNQDISLTS